MSDRPHASADRPQGDEPRSGTSVRAGERRAACPACGTLDKDDGAGCCAFCGHKLVFASGAPSLPAAARVSKWAIGEARSIDDFFARSGKEESLVVVGDIAFLREESQSLEAMREEPAFARVIELGEDEQWGSYLALQRPPRGSRPLYEVARSWTVTQALDACAAALAIAERVEARGLAWTPLRDDVFADATGKLYFARMRGGRKLAPNERLDARGVTEALGGSLLPEPGTRGSPLLVKFLTAHTILDAERMPTVERERLELAGVASDEAARVGSLGSDPVYVVCDRGLRRAHNEDAGCVAEGVRDGVPWRVLVVCDGVSSSTHAEKASAIGARTACDTLARFAEEGDPSPVGRERAVATSIRAAHAAVCAHKFEPRLDGEPPGSTIVVALVTQGRVTVGWLGDSRAYFVGTNGGDQLTRDHSWLNDALARGDMTEEEAMRQPLAHALTRCLGPLEVDSGLGFVEPDVRTCKLDGRGAVILASDGFWNYYPSGAHVAKLVELSATPRAIAERLTNYALACGGHDNITVAVCFND